MGADIFWESENVDTLFRVSYFFVFAMLFYHDNKAQNYQL